MWILQSGVCRIVQRNWRDDIDDPKSKTRKRPLTLGYLVERYRLQSRGGTRAPGEVGLHTDGRQRPPAVGFRRPNITWRQEEGASSIEASKIAGHSTVRMTEEYTKIQLGRQEELTRRVQERLANAGQKQPAALQ